MHCKAAGCTRASGISGKLLQAQSHKSCTTVICSSCRLLKPLHALQSDQRDMVTLWSKWRPYSLLASVALLGSIFIATDLPALAESTALWSCSMLAMRPMSMPPLDGMHSGVPTCRTQAQRVPVS